MSSVTIFDIAFFNYFGISITKYASAAQRSTVDLLRILSVWIFSIVLGLEKFNVLIVPGFVLLAIGFVIYNEIILIPCMQLDYWTQQGIANRENESKRGEEPVNDSLFNITKHTDRSSNKKEK